MSERQTIDKRAADLAAFFLEEGALGDRRVWCSVTLGCIPLNFIDALVSNDHEVPVHGGLARSADRARNLSNLPGQRAVPRLATHVFKPSSITK